MKKPFLFIIPHGGYQIPQELSQLCTLSNVDLFFEADTGAYECFALTELGTVISTPIHRLFIDVDRSLYTLPPKTDNGVMKITTSHKKKIFPDGVFPDEIAIAAMIKRYWVPFHNQIQQSLSNHEFIVVCHTIAPVAPPIAHNAGSPRPLILIEHATINGSEITTCEQKLAIKLLDLLAKAFAGENYTVTTPFCLGQPQKRYIMRRYAQHLPIVRISLSKSLFINEKFFDPNTLTIAPQRIQYIQKKLYECFDTFLRYIQ